MTRTYKEFITSLRFSRTIVVKLFNKISLPYSRYRLSRRILFPSIGIQFLSAQNCSKGELKVHVPTGTPATSVLRQHYVAQSPVLVLRVARDSRGCWGALIQGTRVPSECPLYCISLVTTSRRSKAISQDPLREHRAILWHVIVPDYNRFAAWINTYRQAF